MSSLFDSSLRALRSEIIGKRGRVESSLAALTNQTGSFADDHRRLLIVYDLMLDAAQPKVEGLYPGCRTPEQCNAAGRCPRDPVCFN